MPNSSIVWKLRRLPGKLKGYYISIGLHKLTNPIVKFFHFLHYLNQLGFWINKHKKDPGFVDYYNPNFDYQNREKLFEYVISSEVVDKPITYLEFGVARGLSFFWWINRIKNIDSSFHGFDTFSGLPEDWGGFKKGDMHNDDQIPKSDDLRVRFYKGLFQETLPPFIQEINLSQKLIVHLDADLYSATYYVLNRLAPYFKKGDILFFDEFSVPLSEFKAFIEFQKSHYLNIRLLGSVNNFYQTAFIFD